MAKTSIVQRIKNWLTGGSKGSKSSGSKSTASSGQPKKKKSEEVVERQTERFNKRELLNNVRNTTVKEEPKQEEAKPDYTEKYKATKRTYKSMSGKDSGLADALNKKVDKLSEIKESNKKTPPKPKSIAKPDLTEKQELIEKARTNRELKHAESRDRRKADRNARLAERLEKHEAFHSATNHRYDVGEKGISKEERQRRIANVQTATLGEMMYGRDDEALDVMKARMKYDRVGESARRGLVNAATANALNFAEKRFNKDNRREAEEYYQANKHRGAEIGGSLAGGLLLYGGTAGTFENLGGNVVGRAAETQLGKRLGAEALKRTMAGTGAKAALTRSLVGDAIQDSTIGLLDTTLDVAQRDDLKTVGDYAKAMAQGQAANYAMGLAGNAVSHGLPVVGRAVRNAWSNFADESRKLRIVPKGMDELLAERKQILDDIFSKNERSDPVAIDRLKEIDAEIERIKGASADEITEGTVKKQKRKAKKTTDESVKKPGEAAEPKAKITEESVKKEAKRKPTKTERLRDDLVAERNALQERYEVAKANGEDVTQILDDMQECDLLIKDAESKIARAEKARKTRAEKVAKAATPEPRVEAETPRAEAETPERGIAPRADVADEGARASENANAGAGERTEFRRSEEQTEREQARNRRTTNNRQGATQESFDRDFAAFEEKVRTNQAKASELKDKIRRAVSEEEREALKSQLDELNAEIRREYNRASMRYHPDRGGSNEWMGRFNSAYDDYRRGSYRSRGFRNAESSQRTNTNARSDAYERYRNTASAGNGGGNTPPPRGNSTASGGEGFKRPKGKARKSEPSYVYRGEDTVFKRKEKTTLKQKGEKVVADARMRFSDSHAPFEDDARKFAKSNPEKMQDMYGSIDAHRRSNATATRSIHNKQLNYMGDAFENGKSLKDIFKGMDEKTEKAFDYYLLLKHAPDRLREGKPIWDTRTLTDGRRLGDPDFVARLKKNQEAVEDLEKRIRYADSDKTKAALQKELDDLKAEMARDADETIARMKKVWDAEAERVLKEHPDADFENRAKDVYQYTKNELKNLVDAGIVSKEAATEWSARHPFYVPTHRDGYYAGIAGNVHGSSVGAKGVQAATGSDLDIRSIRDQLEEATRQNWEDITLNDMLKSTFGDRITKEASSDIDDDLVNAIENNISIAKSKDGKKFYAEIREGGKKHRVEIEKKYVDGLQDWNKHGKTGVDMIDVPNEALSKAAHVFKDLITEKSPIFMLKNPMRDFPEAYANSRQPREFRRNIGKAIADLANGGPYSTALRDAGISQSSFFDLDKELRKELEKGGKNPLKMLTDKIAAGNQFMEMLPRLTEYIATFEKAGIPLEQASKELRNRAAANAADVTVNFGRSGNISKTINKGLVPFFNPSVQGWSKFVRNFSEQPNVKSLLLLMTRFTAMGAGITAINNYFLQDNPNYQQISARDKANNYLIPVTLGKDKTLNNTDVFIKIPKSRFASVYSLPIVNAFNDNKMDWAEMIKVANDQIAPVSPVENNLFAPLISTMGSPQGKTWYGSPIVPESMMDLQPSEQYDANTSWFGKMAGKATEKLPQKYQISPKKADYLIDAEMGVIGDFALPMATPSRQGDSSNPLKKYGTPFLDVPKRAFSIDSATQNDISSRYYDRGTLLERKKNSANASKEDQAAYKKYESWNNRVKGVTNAIRYVQGSDMPNKQEAYRELTKLRNENMQKALDGRASINNTRDINIIHKYAGTSYTIENLGKSADQKALKAYGAAVYGDLSEKAMRKKIDSDTEFYKGYEGILKTQNALQKVSPKLKGGNALTYAVGLASAGANDDVFSAYGTTLQSRTETASKAQRAKDYLKNNGSVAEFAQLENAVKSLGKLSDVDRDKLEDEAYEKLERGEMSIDEYNTELKKIAYNANQSYVGKAVSLAMSGAPTRAYALYDIKEKNVQKGYNLAAMGIDSRQYREISQACDTDGNGYLKTAEIRDYVANSDYEDKATLFDALCYYNNVRNPFGTPNRYSPEEAAEIGKNSGIKQIKVNGGADNTTLAKDKSSSGGYGGYYRRGYGGWHRWRHYGSSKKKEKPYVAPKIKQSLYKASSSNGHYKSLASSLQTRSGSTALPTTTTKIEPPKVKFKKYEV